VSHETVSSWLYRSSQKARNSGIFFIVKAKRGPRQSRGAGVSRIPNRVSISERPSVGGPKRKFLGHWEGDRMSFQKNSQSILVLRKRKYTLTLSRVHRSSDPKPLKIHSKRSSKNSHHLIMDLSSPIPIQWQKPSIFQLSAVIPILPGKREELESPMDASDVISPEK
jgi:IS30 family transposase